MRKHFLALMLLALLPLVGWAQTATLGQVAVGEYTYGNTTLPVPVVKDSEGAILVEGTHYTVSAKAYKDEACTQEVASLKNLEGGTTYYLKITGEGAYVGQKKAVHFTVKKKALKITVNTDFKRDYLSAVEPEISTPGDLSFDAFATTAPFDDSFASLGGTLTYTYAGKGNKDYPGGEYDITFSGLTSKNYEITYAPKKFTILGTNLSSEAVSVKAGTAFANKTYKGAAYAPADLTGLVLVWNTKELVQGTDFTIAQGTGDWKSAGAGHMYTVNFKGNYSGSKADFGSFTIDQAPVTVTCEDYAINYDAVDHKTTQYKDDVTFTWMGLVGADVANYATVTAGFTKPTNVQVGSTAINAADYALKIEGGAAAGNYNLVGRLDGKLTIKKVDLTVKAKDANKSIGADDPAFELDAPVGLKGGDAINTGAKITFTRVAGTVAGSYDITPDVNTIKIKNGTADRTGNYNIKLATPKGQLTIGKTAITVTFKNASKFYGQADPTFDENSYVVDGLQKGDALPAFTIVRENAGKPAGEAVGYYAISATIANPNPEKYTSVTVVPGALQIKKAQLTFTIPVQNVAIGVEKTALSKATIKVAGINNSDEAVDLYTLDFGGAVTTTGDPAKTNADESVAEGIVATLTAEAQASYEVIGDNKIDAKSAFGKLIVGAGEGGALDLGATPLADIIASNGETKTVTIDLAKRNGRTLGSARNWVKENWVTLTLPFDISVAELSQVLGYAIVNVIDDSKTKVSGTGSEFYGKVTMKGGNGKDDVLAANKPILVKIADDIANVGTAGKVNFGARKIVAPASAEDLTVDAGQGAKFVGTYEDKTVTKADDANIWFMIGGGYTQWAYINSDSEASWTIKPFEAFIDMSNLPASARNMTFYFEELDGSTTAIKSINVDNLNGNKSVEGMYNLNGMKLNGVPTQKGIYIINGKKVVIK